MRTQVIFLLLFYSVNKKQSTGPAEKLDILCIWAKLVEFPLLYQWQKGDENQSASIWDTLAAKQFFKNVVWVDPNKLFFFNSFTHWPKLKLLILFFSAFSSNTHVQLSMQNKCIDMSEEQEKSFYVRLLLLSFGYFKKMMSKIPAFDMFFLNKPGESSTWMNLNVTQRFWCLMLVCERKRLRWHSSRQTPRGIPL